MFRQRKHPERIELTPGCMLVLACASLSLGQAGAQTADALNSQVANPHSQIVTTDSFVGFESRANLDNPLPVAAMESDPMSVAASVFLDSLTDEQRTACTFEFTDEERRHWQAAPMGDAGVRLDEMTPAQREAARALFRSALSAQGLATLDGVLVLERILVKLAEDRGRSGGLLAVDRYFITIYGEPNGDNVWGWRVEGHHLSLTFTCKNEEWTAHGPLFVGAQPARVVGGKHDGKRVLGSTDDNVRRLVESLTKEQRTKATVDGTLPRNIILLPGKDEGLDKPIGLAGAQMSDEQRSAMFHAITQWARMLRIDLAEHEIERMKTGLDETRVLWMGQLGVDAPHYWRIVGPHFAIEYAAPERDPDHVHSLWRDTKNDFGGALLRRHLEEHHSQSNEPCK